ncbi:rhodanese-like domain-containing protein [bacterium]|nr:rhodanese-like domain-containing protein [bacterium]
MKVVLHNGEFRRQLIRILIIVLLVSLWAVLFNIFSSNGISFIGKEEDFRVKPKTGDIFLQSVREKFDYGLAIFVDCRSREQYREGHIPGALSITPLDMDEMSMGFLHHCTPDLEYITYCDGTECDSSVIVANRFKAMGYDNVHIFFGGWIEWIKAGFPIEQGEPLDLNNNNGTVNRELSEQDEFGPDYEIDYEVEGE